MPFPSPRAPSEAAPQPQADIGVLLVHGIGDHREGETLLSFGEPMIDWLREWLEAQPGQRRSSITGAQLKAVRTEAESPAHASMQLDAAAGQASPSQWLWAEAWWGDAVREPASLKLLGWMLTRVPLLVYWHFRVDRGPDFGQGLDRLTAGRGLLATMVEQARMYARLPRMLQALPVALVMQLVVLLALLLWCIPVGPWRQGLIAAVRVMTLTLGDSYVLLEQDIQRAALVDRVIRSYAWLSLRAQRVVVIAHSQGGAIAYEALRRADTRRLAAYFSVGSGLEKLQFLRLVWGRRSGLAAAFLAAPLAAAAAVAGLMDATAANLALMRALQIGFGMGTLLCVLILILQLVNYAQQLEAQFGRTDFPLKRAGQPVPWFDLRAGFDLVPMGRNSQLSALGVVQGVEVVNEHSLVFDHVTYFNARCDFLARCWQRLDEVLGLQLFDPAQSQRLQRVAGWHRWRAAALASSVLLSPLAVVLAVFTQGPLLADVGGLLLDGLKQARLDWVASVLNWITLQGSRLLSWSPAAPKAGVLQPDLLLLAALALLAAVSAWYALALAGWRQASHAFWRRHGAGSKPLDSRWGRLRAGSGVVFWALVAACPFIVVLTAAVGPELTGAQIGRVLLALMAVVPAGAGLLLGTAAPWIQNSPGNQNDLGRAGLVLYPLWGTFSATAVAGGGALMLDTAGYAPPMSSMVASFLALCAGGWIVGLGLPAWRQGRRWLGPGLLAGAALAAWATWRLAPGWGWSGSCIVAAGVVLLLSCVVLYRQPAAR